MEEINWSEKVTNEEVLERIGEKRTILNNILCRKANWIGHVQRRNCLLHDAIEGHRTEVKIVIIIIIIIIRRRRRRRR